MCFLIWKLFHWQIFYCQLKKILVALCNCRDGVITCCPHHMSPLLSSHPDTLDCTPHHAILPSQPTSPAPPISAWTPPTTSPHLPAPHLHPRCKELWRLQWARKLWQTVHCANQSSCLDMVVLLCSLCPSLMTASNVISFRWWILKQDEDVLFSQGQNYFSRICAQEILGCKLTNRWQPWFPPPRSCYDRFFQTALLYMLKQFRKKWYQYFWVSRSHISLLYLKDLSFISANILTSESYGRVTQVLFGLFMQQVKI